MARQFTEFDGSDVTFECGRLPISIENMYAAVRITNDNLIISICRTLNGCLLRNHKEDQKKKKRNQKSCDQLVAIVADNLNDC